MSRKHPGSGYYARLDRARWVRVRRQVLERDGWRCRACGRAGKLECDHVTPLSEGGNPYALPNLQALCRTCHVYKSRSERRTITPAEGRWRALLALTFSEIGA